jgi:hypothetical protein
MNWRSAPTRRLDALDQLLVLQALEILADGPADLMVVPAQQILAHAAHPAVESSRGAWIVEPFEDCCSAPGDRPTRERALGRFARVLSSWRRRLHQRVAHQGTPASDSRSVVRIASACCRGLWIAGSDALAKPPIASKTRGGADGRPRAAARELGRRVAADRLDELPLHERGAEQQRHERLPPARSVAAERSSQKRSSSAVRGRSARFAIDVATLVNAACALALAARREPAPVARRSGRRRARAEWCARRTPRPRAR